MDVWVHEIEVAVFKNEIEDCVNYMRSWAVCGYGMLVFLDEMNGG